MNTFKLNYINKNRKTKKKDEKLYVDNNLIIVGNSTNILENKLGKEIELLIQEE